MLNIIFTLLNYTSNHIFFFDKYTNYLDDISFKEFKTVNHSYITGKQVFVSIYILRNFRCRSYNNGMSTSDNDFFLFLYKT